MSDPLDDLEDKPRARQKDPALEGGIIALRVAIGALLLMSFVVLLGILFTVAPTNPDNSIVSNSLARADDFAGPFKDVFTPEGLDDRIYANYSLAIGVYLTVAFGLATATDKLISMRPKRTHS